MRETRSKTRQGKKEKEEAAQIEVCVPLKDEEDTAAWGGQGKVAEELEMETTEENDGSDDEYVEEGKKTKGGKGQGGKTKSNPTEVPPDQPLIKTFFMSKHSDPNRKISAEGKKASDIVKSVGATSTVPEAGAPTGPVQGSILPHLPSAPVPRLTLPAPPPTAKETNTELRKTMKKQATQIRKLEQQLAKTKRQHGMSEVKRDLIIEQQGRTIERLEARLADQVSSILADHGPLNIGDQAPSAGIGHQAVTTSVNPTPAFSFAAAVAHIIGQPNVPRPPATLPPSINTLNVQVEVATTPLFAVPVEPIQGGVVTRGGKRRVGGDGAGKKDGAKRRKGGEVKVE